MAVGTVSGLNPDETWQLIATNTPSAASTSTFSSISGYKKLILVFSKYTTSVAGPIIVRFNSDSTNGNYSAYQSFYPNSADYATGYINLGVYAYTTQVRTGYLEINNVDKSLPHPCNGMSMEGAIYGFYVDPNPITSITLAGEGGGTISGTFYLYGIAA